MFVKQKVIVIFEKMQSMSTKQEIVSDAAFKAYI